MLLARDKKTGKVTSSTFMAMTYNGRSFYCIAPYTSHSVVREGKECADCHENENVRVYQETGQITMTKWDSEAGTITNTTGVIPVPPDWDQAFQFDFLDYTGDVAGASDPTKWVLMKSEADLSQMLYVDPLTSDQMAKLSLVVSVQENVSSISERFELVQNCPNPFNPGTTIAYRLPEASEVRLTIYTITGQEVTTLVSDHQEAGHYEVTWNGNEFASGVYFYRLKAGEFVETRRMVLLR